MRDSIFNAARVYNDAPNPENLQQLLSRIEEYFLPAPDNACFKCGKTDSENWADGFGPCVDVTVMVANSEEGYSRIMKYVCNDHLIEVCDAFMALGFVSHHHGSTTLLEDRQCPGALDMDACPTPRGYGEEDLEE